MSKTELENLRNKFAAEREAEFQLELKALLATMEAKKAGDEMYLSCIRVIG